MFIIDFAICVFRAEPYSEIEISYPDEETQIKTFTNWCNKHLQTAGKHIENLTTGFADGVLLITLVEALSKDKVSGKVPIPKNRFQGLENVSIALQHLKKLKVNLGTIGKQPP